MSAGFVAGFAVAAGAAAFVLWPLFRRDAAEAERVASALSERQELDSQREMALSALKDLEDDRSTGKIGDADYRDLRQRLDARAVEILKRLDELDAPPAPARPRSLRSGR